MEVGSCLELEYCFKADVERYVIVVIVCGYPFFMSILFPVIAHGDDGLYETGHIEILDGVEVKSGAEIDRAEFL